jgi:dihydrofolate reductase
MRKLVVSEFLTLDGVMQAPGGADEDRRGGFEHGGWQTSSMDEEEGASIDEGLASAGGLLLGRVTYEIFAGYWPSSDEEPIAGILNAMPKYVASTTLQEPLGWNNSNLIKGDVADGVATLKEELGKDLRVIGSGQLAQTLMERDLVDEYHLMIHPVVLGSGQRLFREGGRKVPLRLVNSTTTGTGVQIATYVPERA